ncbi:MAG: ABC transporter ATP-binding protein/permease [Chloroflexi bacterium]|nr:ABC transporter ATP-binding protein/permease [Chloroflexota bacterium]MCL5275685.1 ABC transporter ATP-binding protein/permease [Chloroflexota bacterium]
MNELKRLIPYVKPYWRRAIVLAVFAVAALASGLLEPYFLGLTVDRGITAKDMGAVALYGGLLLVSAAFLSLFNYLKSVWQGAIGTDVVRDLRNMLYRKLQYLPFSWYTTMPTGQIMSRMISDMDAIEQYVAFGFTTMLTEGSTFIFTFIILMTLDWQLTLAVLLPMPLMVYAIVRFRMKIDPAWVAVREQMGRLTTVLQENIAGVRVVKAFAREPHALAQFDEQNMLNRARNIDRAKLEAGAFPMMDFVSGLSFIVMIMVGALRLVQGSLTMGIYFSFTWYIWSIIWPVRMTGWLVSIMRQAAASAPRLFAIADAPEIIRDPAGEEEERRVGDGEQGRSHAQEPARVQFEDVTFSFPDDLKTPVLQGLTFTVEPGKTVAILGGTGSGKSSVINLVPRFYDVTGGRVLIDGVDVRDMKLSELRGQIGIVPQETFLFSAMLKDNIAFGRPGATIEEVVAASKVAQAHEFAALLPKGYETRVGERGVGLSGGQKQRVALARAVLMNPRILILDEATSAVDTETETAIQEAMAQVLRGRTAIIVAQRLSTIKSADKIVVLKDGQVAEEGTHAELLALGGEYTKLYDLQYREQEVQHGDVITDEAMLVA